MREISEEERLRVFRVLGEMNAFFHQPMHFEDRAQFEKFAHEHYPEIRDLYYNIVWNWLSDEKQKEIRDA